MKNLLLLLFIVFGFNILSAHKIKTCVDPKKENKIFEIVYNTLKNKHFVTKKIDDNFSKKMFKTYLDSLDRYKMFLLESDIVEFKKYETKLDDQLKNNDLTFYFMTYDRMMKRMREGKDMYTSILKSNIDFTTNENTIFYKQITTDNTVNLKFKKTKAEQLKHWLNLIKTIFLQNCTDDFLSKNLQPINFVDFVETKKSTINILLDSTLYNFENMIREQIFEYYVNSIVAQFDPHSKYYMAANRDRYLKNQSGKLEGSGITVKLQDNFVLIKKLMAGGPALKCKKLEVDDTILKIAQENEEPVNVAGYNTFDVVKLLKGKSGTNLKLTVKKPDGKIIEVSLKRAIISTNDSYIKSGLVTKNNIKYAVLSFPRFYSDFDDDQIRNATDDFEDELQILKKSDVEGIVIDIRNNSGGSVEAAMAILANFIGKNPVIQVKNKEKIVNTFGSSSSIINWDKNVVLLVNKETASAAEIFVSTFQEYNIGIIVGEQTFGKGTIQEFVDLNDFNAKKYDNVDYGLLKVTTQKFYKLSGKSVQKNGVTPEVKCVSNNIQVRESQIDHALPIDEVKPIKINQFNKADQFADIIKKNQTRIKESFTTGKLNEFKKNYFQLQNLNVNKIATDLDTFIIKKIELDKQQYKNNLEFTSTAADVKLFKKNEYLLQKRKNWLEDLSSDYQIEEAINILENMTSKN